MKYRDLGQYGSWMMLHSRIGSLWQLEVDDGREVGLDEAVRNVVLRCFAIMMIDAGATAIILSLDASRKVDLDSSRFDWERKFTSYGEACICEIGMHRPSPGRLHVVREGNLPSCFKLGL